MTEPDPPTIIDVTNQNPFYQPISTDVYQFNLARPDKYCEQLDATHVLTHKNTEHKIAFCFKVSFFLIF